MAHDQGQQNLCAAVAPRETHAVIPLSARGQFKHFETLLAIVPGTAATASVRLPKRCKVDSLSSCLVPGFEVGPGLAECNGTRRRRSMSSDFSRRALMKGICSTA